MHPKTYGKKQIAGKGALCHPFIGYFKENMCFVFSFMNRQASLPFDHGPSSIWYFASSGPFNELDTIVSKFSKNCLQARDK